MVIPWRITEQAVRDYLRLLRRPRLNITPEHPEYVRALSELEEIAVYLAANREPKERSDGALIFRGRKAQRFQYIVRSNVLENVRPESELRDFGPERHRGGRNR